MDETIELLLEKIRLMATAMTCNPIVDNNVTAAITIEHLSKAIMCLRKCEKGDEK